MGKVILVGVDDTPESQIALRWAVEAAQERGSAVRVIRAYVHELNTWPALGVEGYIPAPPPVDLYQDDLDTAVRFVQDRLGHDRGSGWLANFPAADALLTEAEDADMVVVGTRSGSKLSAAVLGSVAISVASKAPCPVVVVRGERRTGPVVVGTDGSGDSDEAVAFAFEQASASGQPLTVVYCWHPQEQHGASAESTSGLLKNWLAENLEPYQAKHPAVRLTASVLEGRASATLVDLSKDASLVVVGSRGRGGVTGLVLGSVSQSLLHHADSPVAVVRRRQS